MTYCQPYPQVYYSNGLINTKYALSSQPLDPPTGAIGVGHIGAISVGNIGGVGFPSGGWSPGSGWLPSSSWDYVWRHPHWKYPASHWYSFKW